ncbi:MAG TPA: XdhC family protein [Thermoanaerobaculia bacterium]|nr:XdhC family protein [Thermoanaerobaculia bacterium]
MNEVEKIHGAVSRLIAERKAGLLITVTKTEGSTYRRPGACSVIGEDGSITGAISGGCVERDIAERAKQWLADFGPRTVTYDSSSSDDIVFGLGLGCRGKIKMLVQPFDAAHPPELPDVPRQAIAVIGRGSDTEPVAAVARAAGWTAEILRSYDDPPLDDFDAVVIMTHNFLHDVALLERAFASRASYIGLLGPKSRGEEIVTQIGEVTPAMRERLHNPIGLDLGGDSPEAVALSIVAEIQAVFSRGTARPLREKAGPIHEPAGVIPSAAEREGSASPEEILRRLRGSG